MPRAKPGKVTFEVLTMRVKNACTDNSTTAEIGSILRICFEEIKKGLLNGDVISLTHFGVMEAKTYRARKVSNPDILDGETFDLPERRVPKFRAASGFRDAFNAVPVNDEDMI